MTHTNTNPLTHSPPTPTHTTPTYMYVHTHTQTRTHTHPHIHTHIHSHTHSNTHTYTRSQFHARRVRSAESLSYPVVSQLVRDVDVGAGGRRRTVNYERRVVNRNEAEQPTAYRSVYAPHEDTYFQF